MPCAPGRAQEPTPRLTDIEAGRRRDSPGRPPAGRDDQTPSAVASPHRPRSVGHYTSRLNERQMAQSDAAVRGSRYWRDVADQAVATTSPGDADDVGPGLPTRASIAHRYLA